MARLGARFVTAYLDALQDLNELAASDVELAMAGFLDDNPGATVSEAREAAVEALTQAGWSYGSAANELANAVYDEVMAAEGVGVAPADARYEPDSDEIERVARYQAGKLRDGDADGFVAQCAKYAADSVYMAADGATTANVARDSSRGVRFARVLGGGENTCTFCVMLASRGCVYKTATSANSGRHRNCHCGVVAGVAGQTTVEGHDLEELRGRWQAFEEIDGYRDAKTGAKLSKEERDYLHEAYLDGGEVEAMLAAVQKARDTVVGIDRMEGRPSLDVSGKDVVSELGRRNRDWLLTGKVPEVDTSVVVEKTGICPQKHEIDTAERLAKAGFNANFQVDFRYEKDGNVTIGLPDLDDGTELKSLLVASSANASIDRHLRSAGHKEGLVSVVIDNSWGVLDDIAAIRSIRKNMEWRHVNDVLYIASDGSMGRMRTK